MATETVPQLPIVDLSKENSIPGTPLWLETCDRVRHALEEYGCFVAFYDKVPSELKKEVFDVLKDYFDLPTQTKIKNTSDMVNGYIGQLPHAPLHESTGIPNPTTVEGVERFTNLMWPHGNDRFRNAVLSYSKIMREMENLVHKIVFESYGAGKHFEQHIQSSTYTFRPTKYMPFQEGLEHGNVGGNVHTDKGFLTIINQTQVNGLKVETKDGKYWIDVDVPPESFVVMAGDAYQAWSNDRIHSPKHQVLMTGDEPRYCAILFSYNKGIVEIPEELVDEEHPLQYKPFEHPGLIAFYFSGLSSDMTGSSVREYCGITA